jgi:hypothetical protein
MIYNSFMAFMDAVVFPRRDANPSQIRLDGQLSGGNREVAGEFRHRGKVWKVHADTRYEPLILAYTALKDGKTRDPFSEQRTKKGTCLVLEDQVRGGMGKARGKYIYIYQA